MVSDGLLPKDRLFVELGFESDWTNPFSAGATDVTKYVRAPPGITIRRGRVDVLGQQQAGTATLTFDNAGGLFTDGNTASRFYPDWELGVPLRLSAAYGAYLDFNNESGSYASATISSGSPTTSIEFIVRADLTTFNPTDDDIFIDSTANSQRFYRTAADVLAVRVEFAGTPATATSTVEPPGTSKWFRAVYSLTAGTCDFYASDEPHFDYAAVTWTAVGTQVTGLTTGTADAVSTAYIGANTSGALPADGQFYRAVVLHDSAVVFDWDPFRRTAPGFTDEQGNTWAMTGEGWSWSKRHLRMYGVAGTYAKATGVNTAAATSTVELRARVNYVAAPRSDMWLVGGTNNGRRLLLQSGGELQLQVRVGGSNQGSISTADIPLGTQWLRAVYSLTAGTIDYYTSTNTTWDHTAVTWSALGAQITGLSTGTATSIADIYVGAAADGTGPMTGDQRLYRVLEINDGTDEWDWDGYQQGDLSSFVSGTTGETWTMTTADPDDPDWRASPAGVKTQLFQGYLADTFEEWPDGVDATVTCVFEDGLAVLNRLPMVPTWDDYVTSLSPWAWWKLNETSGTTAQDNTANNNDGTIVGGPTLNQQGPYGDTRGVLLASGDYVERSSTDFDGSSGCTLAVWARWDGTGSLLFQDIVGLYDANNSSNEDAINLFFSPRDRVLIFEVLTSDGTPIPLDYELTPVPWTPEADKSWHLYVMRFSGSTWKVFIDGEFLYESDTYTAPNSGGSDLIVGANYYGGSVAAQNLIGNLSEAVFWESALTDNQIAALYNTGNGGAPTSETANTRITRILDVAGWPTADRALDTGVYSLTADLGAGDQRSVRAAADLAAASDAGYNIITRQGDFAFHDQNARDGTDYTWPKFGDTGAADEIRYRNTLQWRRNRDRVRNKAIITGVGGIRAESVDATSVNTNGPVVFTASLSITQANADAYAAHIVSTFKTPVARFDRIEFQPESSPDLGYQAALRAESGMGATVERAPPVGDAISETVVVEHVTHMITADDWVTELRCSPSAHSAAW